MCLSLVSAILPFNKTIYHLRPRFFLLDHCSGTTVQVCDALSASDVELLRTYPCELLVSAFFFVRGELGKHRSDVENVWQRENKKDSGNL